MAIWYAKTSFRLIPARQRCQGAKVSHDILYYYINTSQQDMSYLSQRSGLCATLLAWLAMLRWSILLPPSSHNTKLNRRWCHRANSTCVSWGWLHPGSSISTHSSYAISACLSMNWHALGTPSTV
jgi:hypothetical protein